MTDVQLLEALRAIGSDTALLELSNIARKVHFRKLQQTATGFMFDIASERGLSPARLEDRIVPALGLDGRGSRVFDFGPRQFELVLSRDLALHEFSELGVDLAHVLGNLAAQVLIDLDNLELGLRYLALGLGNGSYQLTALALQPRAVALEGRKTGDLHQVIFPKLAHSLEFLADQRDLPCLRFLLSGETAYLVL